MVTEGLKSLIPSTKDIAFVGEGNGEECSTADLDDVLILRKDAFLLGRFIFHFDLEVEFYQFIGMKYFVMLR